MHIINILIWISRGLFENNFEVFDIYFSWRLK